MPRYMVERTFPDRLHLPMTAEGEKACLDIIEVNRGSEVTWIHSYVSRDRKKTYCIYDGPSPEVIRRTSAQSGLPVDHVTEVRVLDPYFYQ